MKKQIVHQRLRERGSFVGGVRKRFQNMKNKATHHLWNLHAWTHQYLPRFTNKKLKNSDRMCKINKIEKERNACVKKNNAKKWRKKIYLENYFKLINKKFLLIKNAHGWNVVICVWVVVYKSHSKKLRQWEDLYFYLASWKNYFSFNCLC